jgi:predicted hydrocarbon binding protein
LEKNTVEDVDTGWIMEDGVRVVTLGIKTFQAMMDGVTNLAGSTATRALLYQMGEEIGETAMRHTRNSIKSPLDLPTAFDRVLSRRGWGRCLNLELTSRDGGRPYVCILKGTPTTYQRTANEPTCHLMRGLVVGWLEAYLHWRAQSSTETACASMGNEHCVFEVEFELLTDV